MKKDELLTLLKSKRIDEFNSSRTYDEAQQLDLSESDFRSVVIKKADLSNATLDGTDFFEAVLIGVNFSDSNLSSVDFTRATLEDVNFSGTNLNGAKFNGATVSKCDFVDADVSGTDFCEADLSGADLAGVQNIFMCKFDSFTVWPDADALPEDFLPEYEDDLASLKDEEDSSEEYCY